MLKLLIVLFTILILFFLLFFLFNNKKPYNRSIKTNNFSRLIPTANEKKYNPDININNWDLHKIRLKKFGRSQYKGLTFFISSENRIYYLSDKGIKIYC